MNVRYELRSDGQIILYDERLKKTVVLHKDFVAYEDIEEVRRMNQRPVYAIMSSAPKIDLSEETFDKLYQTVKDYQKQHADKLKPFNNEAQKNRMQRIRGLEATIRELVSASKVANQ